MFDLCLCGVVYFVVLLFFRDYIGVLVYFLCLFWLGIYSFTEHYFLCAFEPLNLHPPTIIYLYYSHLFHKNIDLT